MLTNKLKILNDPIYGFITIPDTLVFDLIQHPYFQRLRRISQMGLSYLVYPGANHTRFHHALGCLHIMRDAVETLRFKGTEISKEEERALYIAILLHDIGHGPFSHAMEHSIAEGVSHESVSLLFMEKLNAEFKGELSLAIRIFKGEYHRKFMLQLISSQLDMDRLDYLRRDSFYTGVAEGNINSERLIQMMAVADDTLMVEEKGIYSVEKFLVARRLMYWQAYLHKTSLGAELVLTKVLKRAKELVRLGKDVPANRPLAFFLENKVGLEDFSDATLDLFSQLDDYDIICALKNWQHHEDFVLRRLSLMILNRDLPRTEISDVKFSKEVLDRLVSEYAQKEGISHEEARYFAFKGKIRNQAYDKDAEPIRILKKNRTVEDVIMASDQLNLKALTRPVTKYYICFPKVLAEK